MKVLEIQTWVDMFDPSEINLDKLEEYLEFIKEAIERYDPTRYSEWHHVIPRCLDKDSIYDNETALINGRDHFLAHMKLIYCFNGIKKRSMSCAAIKMQYQIVSHNEEVTSEEYEEARRKHSESLRENPTIRGQSGEKNGMYGKKHTEESRKKMSESQQKRLQRPEDHIQRSLSARRYFENLSDEKREELSRRARRENLSKDTIQKMSTIRSKYLKEHPENRNGFGLSGPENPCYGRVWLTNGEDNKFVIPNSEKYLSLINTGYVEGRTIHWNSMR